MSVRQKDRLSFSDRLHLWWLYGLPLFNSHPVIDMYGEVIARKRIDWENEDWRAELKRVLFKNSPPSWTKDTSWKTMKKTGMSKKRWRILSSGVIPDERPETWEECYHKRVSRCLLPEEYLRLGNGGKWLECELSPVLDKFVSDVRTKSKSELVLAWEAGFMPEISPADFACLVCMGWWGEKSHEFRNRNGGRSKFADWGFGADFYGKLMSLVEETHFFDAHLMSDETFDIVDFMRKWYAAPHVFTGMFSVLEPDDHWKAKSALRRRLDNLLPRMMWGVRWRRICRGPYKADEMPAEVCERLEAELRRKLGDKYCRAGGKEGRDD